MMNNGPGVGGFPPPNGNVRMGNQNWHNGPPRFNHPCPWGPPQSPRPERPHFNINRFMHPPHTNNNMPGPDFVPDDIFGPQTCNVPHHENFPFNSQHNSHHGNGPQFHGHPGQGRGFMRGGRGGQQGFRGHQRGGFGGGQSGRGGFGGSQPNRGGKNKKKEKVNKRDLPENNAFFCDSCDRGFKTEEKYKEHVDGHIKCSYKDCPFIAAPKLVQLHMSMQHRSGLAKKVWSMESEEDVNKWREDRKRNYPTADNIARKRKERSERMARGEVLETKDFSKMRGGRGGRDRGRGGRGNNRGRGRGKWRDYDRAHENKSEARAGAARGNVHEDDDDDDDDSAPEEVKIKRSRPQDDEFTDTAHKEEVISPRAKAPQQGPRDTPPAEQKSHGGGLALLASYGGSSSEDETEGEEDGEIAESGPASQAVGNDKSSSVESTEHATVTAESRTAFTSSPKKNPGSLPNPFATSSSPSSLSAPSKASSSTVPCRETMSNDLISSLNNSKADNKKRSDPAENNSESLDTRNETADVSGGNDTKSPKLNSDSDSSGGGSKPHRKRNKRGSRNNNKDGNTDNFDDDDKETQRGPTLGTKREHSVEQKSGPSAKKKKGQPPPQQQLRKYTLLEKLLAPDIRRERNKILQCVHYIVKNKFFETDPASSKMIPEASLVVASSVTKGSE